MKVEDFISSLNDLDPDYLIVPENVDLSGVEVVQVQRGDGSGYTYPDGVYFDRDRARFEELATEVA